MLAIDFTNIVNPADVGVGNRPGPADFVIEQVKSLVVLGEVLGEEFQGYRLGQLEVVGAVDSPIPPRPNGPTMRKRSPRMVPGGNRCEVESVSERTLESAEDDEGRAVPEGVGGEEREPW
ncbi:MAG: hypothetical protein VX768_05455 [Planctomycetota bacterium]|nr:hypothetical protein [Planctomycetota bacterium]